MDVTVCIVVAIVVVAVVVVVGVGVGLTSRAGIGVVEELVLGVEFARAWSWEAGTISTSVSLMGVVHCHSSSESSAL